DAPLLLPGVTELQRPAPFSAVRDFGFGQTYTRGEIRQALGGDLSSSLPHRDGRVVCGCFRPDLNPDAPDVILSGRGPKIERWARVFATQRQCIPCFAKAATNARETEGVISRCVAKTRAPRSTERARAHV